MDHSSLTLLDFTLLYVNAWCTTCGHALIIKKTNLSTMESLSIIKKNWKKFKHIGTIWLWIKKLNKDNPYLHLVAYDLINHMMMNLDAIVALASMKYVLEPDYYELHPMDIYKGYDSFLIGKWKWIVYVYKSLLVSWFIICVCDGGIYHVNLKTSYTYMSLLSSISLVHIHIPYSINFFYIGGLIHSHMKFI